MNENLQFMQALATNQKKDDLVNEIFPEMYGKLDDLVTPISAPLVLENPPEISLKISRYPVIVTVMK